MKKIILLLLTVSMIAAAFVGCTKPAFGSSSKDTNGNGLRDDVELEIMKAYHSSPREFDPANFRVEYFGTYNGAIAVTIEELNLMYLDSNSSWKKEIVGDALITYSRGTIIKIWINGTLKSFSWAYNRGILTDADVKAIYSAYLKK